jgi:hypothetical protein
MADQGGWPRDPAGAARRWRLVSPERRTGGKGAPAFGAAERTLAGEHRSGICECTTGGSGEITRLSCILLVSSERHYQGRKGFQRERNRRVSFPLAASGEHDQLHDMERSDAAAGVDASAVERSSNLRITRRRSSRTPIGYS